MRTTSSKSRVTDIGEGRLLNVFPMSVAHGGPWCVPKKQELLRVSPVEYTRLGVNETLFLLKQKFLQHQLQKQGKKKLLKRAGYGDNDNLGGKVTGMFQFPDSKRIVSSCVSWSVLPHSLGPPEVLGCVYRLKRQSRSSWKVTVPGPLSWFPPLSFLERLPGVWSVPRASHVPCASPSPPAPGRATFTPTLPFTIARLTSG